MKEKVTCKDVMRHVCENLGEELNSEKCVDIKNHLDNCAACKNYFKSIEITIDCYKKYNVNLPEDAHIKLMKLLNLDK
jgi:predicted anti-sigma-YlaC factor YlaD